MELEKKDIREIIETSYRSNQETEEYCNTQMIQIIKNMKDIRTKKGMSLMQLAEKSDLSKNYLYKVEKYRCNVSVVALMKICQALEVRIVDVFPEDNENVENISRADVFQHLTKNMSEKEQNSVLELIRICVGLKESN